ncbi:glycerophosphodiester phosphodiesterase family protein [Christiangramia forsetii]|nr:glycerophosphodiester phosphodiesterase family protein [Christiangramia forsetii]
MKFHKFYLLLFFTGLLVGCKSIPPEKIINNNFPDFLIEGHRGARGLSPENTIPSMIRAIDDGANVLELDIQISKDKQVVVTHDAYLSPKLVLLSNGEKIAENSDDEYIIHKMDYDSIRKFKLGMLPQNRFPRQQSINTYIPLLGELIDSVETYTSKNNLSKIFYNIEIKSNPEKDGHYQPEPKVLMPLVMNVLNNKNIDKRFYIQSFDVRQIQEVRANYPNVPVGFLTGNKKKTFEENIESIGFMPEIYSPHFSLVTKELIEKCHQKAIKIIPWTVNTIKEIENLRELGVDGIITDFPNLVK